MGLIHAHGDDGAGCGGDGRHHPDRRRQAEEVGDSAGKRRADGKAAVPPQTVNAHR